MDSSTEAMKMRAHHAYCLPVIEENFDERGAKYCMARDNIISTLTNTNALIKIVEGVDALCKTCPLCTDDVCKSPHGDEVQVRKWDAIIMKELGLQFEDALTVAEFQTLIKEKSPIKLCYRCPWRQFCNRGKNTFRFS